MTYGGEKAFTEKARAHVVAQFLALAKKSDQESARLRQLANAVQDARTPAALEKARRQCRSGDPDLLYFCHDTRNLCHYCGRKGHGGVGSLLHGHPDWFCCWRDECQRRFDKDIIRDKKDHPRAWAKRRARAKRRSKIWRASRSRPRKSRR